MPLFLVVPFRVAMWLSVTTLLFILPGQTWRHICFPACDMSDYCIYLSLPYLSNTYLCNGSGKHLDFLELL